MIFIFYCFFLLFEEKTNPLGSGLFHRVSAHLSSAHRLQRADATAKVTSAGMMTELLSEKTNVLDLTVGAD